MNSMNGAAKMCLRDVMNRSPLWPKTPQYVEMKPFSQYDEGLGSFGLPLALRARGAFHPTERYASTERFHFHDTTADGTLDIFRRYQAAVHPEEMAIQKAMGVVGK
jgi:hypothetical protein